MVGAIERRWWVGIEGVGRGLLELLLTPCSTNTSYLSLLTRGLVGMGGLGCYTSMPIGFHAFPSLVDAEASMCIIF